MNPNAQEVVDPGMVSVERLTSDRRWFEGVSAGWREDVRDPSLRDLPSAVQTKRGGQRIVSPPDGARSASSDVAVAAVACSGGIDA